MTIDSRHQLPPVGFKPQKTSETSRSHPRVFINKKKQQVYKIFNTEVLSDYLSFNNELTCLKLLKDNFINNQDIPYYPFPEIYNYDSTNLSIMISFCGQTARTNRTIKPVLLQESVECIIDNLKQNKIRYKDIHPSNVCIDKNGYIYLIDFESVKFKLCEDYYKKPVDLERYNDLSIDNLGPWMMKPWSILYMFRHDN